MIYTYYGYHLETKDDGRVEVMSGNAKGIYANQQEAEDACEFEWGRSYDRCH